MVYFVTWEVWRGLALRGVTRSDHYRPDKNNRKGGKHDELGTVVLPEPILQRWGLDGPARPHHARRVVGGRASR